MPRFHEIIPSPLTPLERDWPDDNESLLDLHSLNGKSPPQYFSVKDAFEGVQVFGSTGSGKSSGSGKALAMAFLDSNFGGLVLTAKTDERLQWQRYADKAGRSGDLLIFGPGSKYRFNFLRYELSREGRGAGHTENLVNLFCTVMKTGEQKGGGGGNHDGFWQRAVKQLLRNTIDLVVIAVGDITLTDLRRVITSAPTSAAQASDPDWQQDSICFALIEEVFPRATKSAVTPKSFACCRPTR